jgi:hypothetical protein
MKQIAGDEIVGGKIERMIAHQMSKSGYSPTDKNPSLLVAFGFDVSPAGSVSSSYTTINNAPRTAYVWGNTVRIGASTSSAVTINTTTRIYDKNIVVRISDAKTGEKLWESRVSETGWCNQIFVTAPSILALMFEGFPKEQTNVQRVVARTDPQAKEIMSLFPPDTNWMCQST